MTPETAAPPHLSVTFLTPIQIVLYRNSIYCQKKYHKFGD